MHGPARTTRWRTRCADMRSCLVVAQRRSGGWFCATFWFAESRSVGAPTCEELLGFTLRCCSSLLRKIRLRGQTFMR